MKKYDDLIDFMKTKKITYGNMYSKKIDVDYEFHSKQQRLLDSISKAQEQGANIRAIDQNSEFLHIKVNYDEHCVRKLRLYLSPKKSNLNELAVELINRTIKKHNDIYFKYCNAIDRVDQMVIYLRDSEDLKEKIELLREILREKGHLLEGMEKSVIWDRETEIPNVYLEMNPLFRPNPIFNPLCGKNTSYGKMMENVLSSTKAIMEYLYGIKDGEDLKDKRNDRFFYERFEKVFTELQKRHGIYLECNNGQYSSHLHRHPNDLNNNMMWCSYRYDKKRGVLIETTGTDRVEKKEHEYNESSRRYFLDSFAKEDSKTF